MTIIFNIIAVLLMVDVIASKSLYENNLAHTKDVSNRRLLLYKMRKEINKETTDRLADSYPDTKTQQLDTEMILITAMQERVNKDEGRDNSHAEYITQKGDRNMNTPDGGYDYTKSNAQHDEQKNNDENRKIKGRYSTGSGGDTTIYKGSNHDTHTQRVGESYYQYGEITEDPNNPKRWETHGYHEDVYDALLEREHRFDQSQQEIPITKKEGVSSVVHASAKVKENVDLDGRRSDVKTELKNNDNDDGRKRVIVVQRKASSSVSSAKHTPETFIKSSYDNESPSFHGFNLNPDERIVDPWSERTFWLLLIMLIVNSVVILFCIYGQKLEKYKKEQRRKSFSMSFGSGSRRNIKIGAVATDATDSDVDDETDEEFVE